MVRALFVYGTLQPGDVRWSFLAPYAADDGTIDSVGGRLYDTGRGYPAATFGDDGVIHGRVFGLRPDTLDEALAVIDAEESSVEGLYQRVVVETHGGRQAFAYAYGRGLDLTPIPSGRWTPNA